MHLVQEKHLLPTRREVAARIFRQRTVFIVFFLLVALGFVVTGQFTPKYQSEMKILIRKDRIDPIVTSGQESTPVLQNLSITEEELNSQAEMIKGEGTLRQVVLQAGLVPGGSTDPIAVAKATRKLQRNLDISAVAKTDLISIRYRSPDPEQSRRVLETLASAYLNQARNTHGQDYQISFFEDQVKEHATALQAAQAKLMDFTTRTGVVSADLERDLTIRQIKDMSAEQMQTEAELADAKGRTAQLSALMLSQPARIPTDSKTADNPQLLNQLKGTLLTLQLKRTELLNKYDPHYRLVEDVDREIATAQAALDAQEAAPIREAASGVNPARLEIETDLAKSRAQMTGLSAKASQINNSIATLQNSARDLTSKDAEQGILEQNVKAEKDQYQLYLDKLEQAKMTHALNAGGVLDVIVAQQPVTPALPENSPLGVLTAMLFTGGLLSFGAAFLSDVFDPTVRNPTELGEVLNAPLLAEFGRQIYLTRGEA